MSTDTRPAPPQFVKIENVGTEVWNDKQPGHPYTIAPGVELVVPWNVMCMWLGDPHARDSGRNPERGEEVTRLHLRYGVTSDMEGDNRPSWSDAMPKLVVKDLTGVQIATVADDPTGELTPAAAPLLTPEDTASRIAFFEAELLALKAGQPATPQAIAQTENPAVVAGEPTPATSGQPPVDAPSARNQRGGKS
jgi:hypothetical protein